MTIFIPLQLSFNLQNFCHVLLRIGRVSIAWRYQPGGTGPVVPAWSAWRCLRLPNMVTVYLVTRYSKVE